MTRFNLSNADLSGINKSPTLLKSNIFQHLEEEEVDHVTTGKIKYTIDYLLELRHESPYSGELPDEEFYRKDAAKRFKSLDISRSRPNSSISKKFGSSTHSNDSYSNKKFNKSHETKLEEDDDGIPEWYDETDFKIDSNFASYTITGGHTYEDFEKEKWKFHSKHGGLRPENEDTNSDRSSSAFAEILQPDSYISSNSSTGELYSSQAPTKLEEMVKKEMKEEAMKTEFLNKLMSTSGETNPILAKANIKENSNESKFGKLFQQSPSLKASEIKLSSNSHSTVPFMNSSNMAGSQLSHPSVLSQNHQQSTNEPVLMNNNNQSPMFNGSRMVNLSRGTSNNNVNQFSNNSTANNNQGQPQMSRSSSGITVPQNGLPPGIQMQLPPGFADHQAVLPPGMQVPRQHINNYISRDRENATIVPQNMHPNPMQNIPTNMPPNMLPNMPPNISPNMPPNMQLPPGFMNNMPMPPPGFNPGPPPPELLQLIKEGKMPPLPGMFMGNVPQMGMPSGLGQVPPGLQGFPPQNMPPVHPHSQGMQNIRQAQPYNNSINPSNNGFPSGHRPQM